MPHPSVALAAVTAAAPDAHLVAARQLQAFSFAFHIVLVAFGVAMPAMVLVAEWRGRRRGDPGLVDLARRWSKVMVVLFAVGVVSGTVLSFELGLLWPGFMKHWAAVFGAAFAMEGFSFFIEAIFLAIYVYGWDRLPAGWHLASGIPVVISGLTGSLFVLSVNAWMNTPTGFRVENGQPVDIHPVEALLSHHLWHTYVHMMLAGYMVAGFLTAGVYARGWMRGRRDAVTRAAIVIPLTFACVAAVSQVVVGDWAGRDVAHHQPVKLAAFEGLGTTQDGAPVHIGGWYRDGEVVGGIPVPHMLSLLAFHRPDARVEGLDAVPVADQPPVNVVRIAFQTMVGIGTALVALAVWFLVALARRRAPPANRWFWRALTVAGPASVLALWAGWTTTEVGRQPWVVYGHMRTAEAVTSSGAVVPAFAVLVAVYAALGVIAVAVVRRVGARPPGEDAT